VNVPFEPPSRVGSAAPLGAPAARAGNHADESKGGRVPSDKERYRFDLNGYLVVPQALDPAQVAQLNELVDRYDLQSQGQVGGSFLELDVAFRDLIANPRVTPYLDEWVGAGARLDHVYFIFSDAGYPAAQMHLGATPYVPQCSYHVRNGRIFSALTVVSYVLADTPRGQGFACIPGSHKSDFPCPSDVAEHVDQSFLEVPAVQPGDAVVFTEALTHGSTAWTAPTQRRALFYKYSPGYMTWMHPRWSEALLDACKPEQREYLEPPYVADQSAFFNTTEPAVEKVRPWAGAR
jgi:ectoine hydroxylase-related dioxygenase (phytanoyl-CoA dioxygenase family)